MQSYYLVSPNRCLPRCKQIVCPWPPLLPTHIIPSPTGDDSQSPNTSICIPFLLSDFYIHSCTCGDAALILLSLRFWFSLQLKHSRLSPISFVTPSHTHECIHSPSKYEVLQFVPVFIFQNIQWIKSLDQKWKKAFDGYQSCCLHTWNVVLLWNCFGRNSNNNERYHKIGKWNNWIWSIIVIIHLVMAMMERVENFVQVRMRKDGQRNVSDDRGLEANRDAIIKLHVRAWRLNFSSPSSSSRPSHKVWVCCSASAQYGWWNGKYSGILN